MKCKSFIILIFLTFHISGCTNSIEGIKQRDKYIELLSDTSYSGLLIIPINKGFIFCENLMLNSLIYQRYYKNHYTSYDDFLKSLYDYKINDIGSYFNTPNDYINIDNKILKEYNFKGINYILGKYLVKNNKEVYEFKYEFNETVCFIMFINEFFVYRNCYTGLYHFSKIKENQKVIDFTPYK